MSDLLNRSFTRREKNLLLVLILVLLVGLYFMAVHYPIVNRMEQIERDSEDTDVLLEAAEVKMAEYISMKKELEEILSQPEEDITVMPPYSNIKTLMRKLDDIFDGTSPDFTFGQANIDDGIAARKINFTCTAADYQEARTLIRDMTGTGYRCLLDSFTMTPEGEDLYSGELNLSGVITFYEYAQQDEAQQDEVLPDGEAEE